MKTRFAAPVLTLAMGIVFSGVSSFAVDQTAVGKRLVIKNPPSGPANNKLSLTAVGGFLNPQNVSEDPRCAPDGSGTASLTVRSSTTGETFTIDLGGANCANWVFRAGTGPYPRYRYRDSTGATCNTVIVVNGKRLKALCRGPQVAYDLGADQGSIDAVLTLGVSPRRYCTTFGPAPFPTCNVRADGSDGVTYSASRCSSSGVCPSSASGAFVDP